MKAFIILSVLAFSLSGFARKPAVEEFIGVEPEGYVQTTAATDVQFNFGNTIKAYNSNQSSTSTNWFSIFALGTFVSLPFFLWAGMTRSMRKEEVLHQTNTTTNNADITNLSDYRNQENESNRKAS